MAYSDFNIDRVALDFDLKVRKGTVVDHGRGEFAAARHAADPIRYFGAEIWRTLSEFSRREFLIAPVLLACRELLNNEVYFYSGITFDVDADKKLTGQCDYLFSWTPPTPVLQAPICL